MALLTSALWCFCYTFLSVGIYPYGISLYVHNGSAHFLLFSQLGDYTTVFHFHCYLSWYSVATRLQTFISLVNTTTSISLVKCRASFLIKCWFVIGGTNWQHCGIYFCIYCTALKLLLGWCHPYFRWSRTFSWTCAPQYFSINLSSNTAKLWISYLMILHQIIASFIKCLPIHFISSVV